MNLFKKKFKVRLSHWYKENYCIEYANYRFLCVWHEVRVWRRPSLSFDYPSYEGWGTLFSANLDGLEKIAKSFKTILDIENFYLKFEKEAKEYDAARKEYWDRKVPFNKKNIL